MVIKGNARGGAAGLAAHLQRTDTNEVAELRELRGVAAEDLEGALLEMEAVASGARSARHFYHASMNTRADEALTWDQWQHAVDRLESELGLTGQPRAVVAHVKHDRAHVHIAWSRIDLETFRAIPDSHNYRRHEIVARELEREFGHTRVQGAHVERDGERPERTPSHAEMQQAERSGLTPAEAKAILSEIWNRTDSGQAFAAAIGEQGWILARGDKRDFVVLDPAGETHSLARRIEGAKAKDVRARMSDIDPAALPSVAEARQAQGASLLQPAVLAQPIETAQQEGKEDGDSGGADWRKEQDAWCEAIEPQTPMVSALSDASSHVAASATNVASKLGDLAIGLLAGIGGSTKDKQSPNASGAALEAAARQEDQKVTERISEDKEGRHLKSEDVAALPHENQERLLANGDDAIRQMVEEARKRADRHWQEEEERTRER